MKHENNYPIEICDELSWDKEISLDPQLEGLKTTVDLATFTGYEVAILKHRLVLVMSFTYDGSGQTLLVNLEVDAPGGFWFVKSFMALFPGRALSQCEGGKVYVEHNQDGMYRFIKVDASQEAWFCPSKLPDGRPVFEAKEALAKAAEQACREKWYDEGAEDSVTCETTVEPDEISTLLIMCEGHLKCLRAPAPQTPKKRLAALYTALHLIRQTVDGECWFSITEAIDAEERYDAIKRGFVEMQEAYGVCYDVSKL